jgi:hypothetical protein
MRHIHNYERRFRLATRHALTASSRVRSPEQAASAVVALHATDAPTVYLSTWARTTAVSTADIDRALYTDRTLVKQLAMRRTLFSFPRDLIPAVLPSAAARVANSERSRMSRDIERAGVAASGLDWLNEARRAVVATIAAKAVAMSAAELRSAIPFINVVVQSTAGESWSAPQLLTLFGAEGVILRGPSIGRFPTARPLWTLPMLWLGTPTNDGLTSVEPTHNGEHTSVDLPGRELAGGFTAADGYRELVHRWLFAFGPGTEDDLVWWLGSTKSAVRTALREIGAVRVEIDGPAPGWLLGDDRETVPSAGPWTALLPPLDPTVMGWKNRGFYLGAHGRAFFDSRGNAGTTVWVDGRIVGCWAQDRDAIVRLRFLEPVAPEAHDSLAEQASLLTYWLDGAISPTGYRSPAMRELSSEWAE